MKTRGFFKSVCVFARHTPLPILIVSLLAGCGGGTSTEIDFEALRAEIRSKGWPTNFEELQAWYATPPPEQNGADLILEGITQIQNSPWAVDSSSGYYSFRIPERGQWFAENKHEEIVDFFKDSEVAMDLIRQGLEMETRYPVELRLSNGVANFNSRPISDVKMGFDLFEFSVSVRFQSGDITGGVDELLNIYRLAESLKDYPILGGLLMRNAGHAIGRNAMSWMLSVNPLPENELSRMHDYLNSLEEEGTSTTALIGELAYFMDEEHFTERFLYHYHHYGLTTMEEAREYAASELIDKDIAFAIEQMIKIIDLSTRPAHEFLVEGEALTEESMRIVTDEGLLFSMDYISVFDDAKRRNGQLVAGLRLAKTAVAVERYRLANDNVIPDALDSLVPDFLEAIPTDPFNGQSLGFEKGNESSYKISSVGEENFDITFEVQR